MSALSKEKSGETVRHVELGTDQQPIPIPKGLHDPAAAAFASKHLVTTSAALAVTQPTTFPAFVAHFRFAPHVKGAAGIHGTSALIVASVAP